MSVIGVLVLIVLVVVVLTSIPSKYDVKGNVGVTVDADPASIGVGDKSTIMIEIKNMDKDDEVTVDVEAKTYDKNFLFTRSGEQHTYQRGVAVGPKEVRNLKFDVRAMSGALPGKYRVDVSAREKSYAEGAEDKVFIKVVEK